jgi:hypothetical protein
MNRLLAGAAFTALFALSACGGASTAPPSVPVVADATSLRHGQDVLGGIPLVKLNLSLFDAPMPMAGVQVNIAFTEVAAVSAGGAVVPIQTWPNPHVVNLLTLQNGPFGINGNIPAGNYTALEFFIDLSASNIAIGPMKIPLAMPNGPTSIVAQAPLVLTATAGPPNNVTADFNVLQSFSLSGGKASIHPTIIATTNAGQINGTVVNALKHPVTSATVEALNPDGSIANVSITGNDGKFMLHALPAGTYTVQVLNSYTTQWGDVVTASGNDANAAPAASATVNAGATTNLGTLTD